MIRVEHRNGELMARAGEPDRFEAEAQPDFFGAEAAPAYRPDSDKVRSTAQNSCRGAGGADVPPAADACLALSHHFSADDEPVARG
jgi:hypothetical protein